MIRTSRQIRRHSVAKLVVQRETVRNLGSGQLGAVGGAAGPNCTADTFQASGCVPVQADGTSLPGGPRGK
jgi:hypothetical protein